MWLWRGSASDDETSETDGSAVQSATESGTDSQDESADDEEDCRTRAFNSWYYFTYALALVTFIVGLCMVALRSAGIWSSDKRAWPESFLQVNGTETTIDFESVKIAASTINWYLVGNMMMPTGIYLLFNADLVVTFVRFKLEMRQYKATNKRFTKILDGHRKEIRRLIKTDVALRALEGRFGASLHRAMAEMNAMEQDALDSLGSVASDLVKLYAAEGDNNRRRFVDRAGLNTAFSDFDTMFSAVVSDWPQRALVLSKVIKEHEAYQSVKVLRVHALAMLVEMAMVAPDSETLETRACEILDREMMSTSTRWSLEDAELTQNLQWAFG